MTDKFGMQNRQLVSDNLELKRRVTALEDRLRNGIKYDEENNQYILVWTKKELDEAREAAHKLAKFFGTLEEAKDE